MNNKTEKLSRGEKILVFLYEFGSGGRAKVRYEDIVIGLFKKYPNDFHLKGYIEYPDSGDLVHKPLYDFKKKGYVNASNKVFSLTERGVEFAKQLTGKSTLADGNIASRLSRSAKTEIDRVKKSEGFILFIEGGQNKLSDSDFYNYLGVTVRTPKNTFLGRLETMNAAIEELKNTSEDKLYSSIIGYHKLLLDKHKDIVEFFTK